MSAVKKKRAESPSGRPSSAASRKRARKSGPPGPPPAFDRAAVSRVAGNVEILGVDLLGAHFERSDDDALPSTSGEESPDVGIAVEWKMDDDDHLLSCVMTFGTLFEGRREPYTVVARFRVLYAVDPEFRPTPVQINQFAHWNAMFNVWPYWREYLSSTIDRAHLPQFVAPVMRVPIPDANGA